MDLFSSLKNFLKPTNLVIDNLVFQIHYKWTCAALICASILVTARQYIGDPMDCIPAAKDLIPPNMLDTFCWVHGTFSVPSAWEEKVGLDGVVYPGVAKYKKGDELVRHSYYQWVCFLLFLQAMMFYFGRFFWKTVEGGKIKSIILGLENPIQSTETRTKSRHMLVDYIISTFNQHNSYFFCFVLAEVFNFVNVLGQMYLMDAFLGYKFTSYGAEVLSFKNWGDSHEFSPMLRLFPRMAKCNFYVYGSSGDPMKIDTLCLLPINIINEKIYIFLWFYFIILAAASGVMLGYRLVIMFCPDFRFWITRMRANSTNAQDLNIVLSRCQLGDWFLLDLLAKNMDALNFRDVVKDLAVKLEGKSSSDTPANV